MDKLSFGGTKIPRCGFTFKQLNVKVLFVKLQSLCMMCNSRNLHIAVLLLYVQIFYGLFGLSHVARHFSAYTTCVLMEFIESFMFAFFHKYMDV